MNEKSSTISIVSIMSAIQATFEKANMVFLESIGYQTKAKEKETRKPKKDNSLSQFIPKLTDQAVKVGLIEKNERKEFEKEIYDFSEKSGLTDFLDSTTGRLLANTVVSISIAYLTREREGANIFTDMKDFASTLKERYFT